MKESYDALSRDNKKKKVLYIVNDRSTVFCESTLLLYDIIQTRISTMFSRNKILSTKANFRTFVKDK